MASGTNQRLEGGRELAFLSHENNLLGSMLDRIIRAINTTADNASVSPVGQVPAPPPVDSVNVQGTFTQSTNTLTASSEILHWTMTHNQEVKRGVHYFTEVDTNPGFTQPHVIHHGTSRSGFITLPTQDVNGATQTYFLRSYAQYPGGLSSPKTTFGGANNPIGIQMGGTSKLSLLPSTGSGTASATGQQGGQGFGAIVTRPAPVSKRSIVQH